MKKGEIRRLSREACVAAKAENPDIVCICSDTDSDPRHDDDEIVFHRESSDDDDEEMQIYYRSIDESDGFDVVMPKNRTLWEAIVPVDIHQYPDSKADCEAMAEFAIETHNEKDKSNLEFVEVKKANAVMVSGIMYYLTILVKDKEVGRDLICEAQVWKRIKEDKVLELFRIKTVDEGK